MRLGRRRGLLDLIKVEKSGLNLFLDVSKVFGIPFKESKLGIF
jgi:hypothetical protein